MLKDLNAVERAVRLARLTHVNPIHAQMPSNILVHYKVLIYHGYL